MKKRLPIGISDFKKLIIENYYFVDKSLLVKELLDSGAAVTLIPRPRRFGKTLNISMLKYFFEKTEKSNKYLFNDLAISKESEYMKRQGTYPVVFLTFKDIKDLEWKECYEKIIRIIRDEYSRHKDLLKGSVLDKEEEKEFEEILSLTAKQSSYENGLKNLSKYLHRHYKKRPIILIDEYDAPIHSGFMNDYYNPVTNFMRNFLSGGLKDNSDLELSVLTGILRIAKESIFSGLNNLNVCTLLSEAYSDKFGLLENELETLIEFYDLSSNFEEIKKWYNGYTFGKSRIYNPWSIINLANNKGEIKPYWINTSSNDIIKELIKNSRDEVKEDLESLLLKKPVNKPIYDNIVFSDVFVNSDVLWSFLLFSGYLTFKNLGLKNKTICADIEIPNDEVESFYENTIVNWFKVSLGDRKYNEMLKSLIEGDIELFSRIFRDFVLKSFSYFDVSGDEPEKFYHAFVLGLLVDLQNTHQVKSNRESGYGRYDVMIIPNDKKMSGVIIEFKKVDSYSKESLQDAAQKALKQIEVKKYEQELNDLGIEKVIKLAIVFDGKAVLIESGKKA